MIRTFINKFELGRVVLRSLFCILLSCCALMFAVGCSLIHPKVKVEGEKIPIGDSFSDYKADLQLSSKNFIVTNEPCNHRVPDFSSGVVNRTLKFNGNKKFHITNPPVTSKGKLVIMDSVGALQAFDIKSGKKLWSTKLVLNRRYKGLFAPADFYNGGIVEKDGVLYVTYGSNSVKAVNIDDGKIIWSKYLISPTRAKPVLDGRKLLVQTADNGLYALDIVNGDIIWLYSSICEHISIIKTVQPLVYKNYALIQQTNDEIVAIDTRNGIDAFSITTDSFGSLMRIGQNLKAIQSSMLLDGDLLFFSTGDGVVGMVNMASAKVIWNKKIVAKREMYVCGDFLYILDQNDILLAIFKQDGRIKWTQDLKKLYKHNSKDFDWLAPTMINGNVVISHSSGKTFAFHSITGNISDVDNNLHIKEGISMPIITEGRAIYKVYGHGEVEVSSYKTDT